MRRRLRLCRRVHARVDRQDVVRGEPSVVSVPLAEVGNEMDVSKEFVVDDVPQYDQSMSAHAPSTFGTLDGIEAGVLPSRPESGYAHERAPPPDR